MALASDFCHLSSKVLAAKSTGLFFISVGFLFVLLFVAPSAKSYRFSIAADFAKFSLSLFLG